MTGSMQHDQPRLPRRPSDGHKGTFGTACIIGGRCDGGHVSLGAPALGAVTALRSGCGLVTLVMPAPLINAGLSLVPSATGLALEVASDGTIQVAASRPLLAPILARSHAVAIGPGMGVDVSQMDLLKTVFEDAAVPLVVDADALNCLSSSNDLRRMLPPDSILTPHPGEFARLAEAYGFDADPVNTSTRPDAASMLARQTASIVILKGHRTIVSDGTRSWESSVGGPALATGGSGDVLTGLLSGLLAQYAPREGLPEDQQLSNFEVATLGVYLHGCCGDLWQHRYGDAGMLANDLADVLPEVRRGMHLGSNT